MKIKFSLLIMLALLVDALKAQQAPMFTHYMFNTLAINPAYAGSRDALTVSFLHRSQWVGFEGAPKTQTLTLHSPIFVKNAGVGLSVLNDKIGPTNVTSFYADFSYKIQVSTKAHLAFGLKGGMNLMKNDLSELQVQDPNDKVFEKNIQSDIMPNFGFGMYFFTDKYYVGLSVPKLLENDYKNNSVSGQTGYGGEEKHYFLIGGYIYKINEDYKLKPTTFIKVTQAAPIEVDLSAQVIYQERFWGGMMFRTGDALGLLLGAYVTPQLAVGYSYDWSFSNKTFKYNKGSHEILLQYDFIFKDEKKIRSPRYF